MGHGAIAKSFFRSRRPYNPLCPPLKKGGTTSNCWQSSPLKKGDLGGFEASTGEEFMANAIDPIFTVLSPKFDLWVQSAL
jgi:hypothetical protein